MAELIIQGYDIEKLVAQGRVPQIAEGWRGGPFLLIPPEGFDPDVGLLSEQVAWYGGGYGEMIPMTQDEVIYFQLYMSSLLIVV